MQNKYLVPDLNKIKCKAEFWKPGFYESNGKWLPMDNEHQATIPFDKALLAKLGIRKQERVLFIAAFFADWAKALQDLGVKVDYNEVSKEILNYVKKTKKFNKFILSDYIFVPEKELVYDWTVSFEPCGGKRGLPIAILRSLLNKKGTKLIVFPRIKEGKPVGSKETTFPKILSTFSKVYNVKTKKEFKFIKAKKAGGKEIKDKHLIYTVLTNNFARKKAKSDLSALNLINSNKMASPKSAVQSIKRLNQLALLIKPEFLKTVIIKN